MTKLAIALFSLLKLGKVGGTLITMLISLGAYALVFGWRYAAGFVGLLLVHEMGHFLAARQRGLAVGAPTFIPFVGAWIALKEQPLDAETEAYVGLAGPLVGTLGAVACYFAGRDLQDQTLLAVSYAGFFLNFFNLIPLHPLDGGRITGVLGPRMWFFGVPVMAAMMIYSFSPLLVAITIMAVPSLIKAWKHDGQDPDAAAYYAVPDGTKFEYGVLYLGLLAYLAVMTHEVHGMIGAA